MFNPIQSRTLAIAGAALPTFGMAAAPVLVPVKLAEREARASEQKDSIGRSLENRPPCSEVGIPSFSLEAPGSRLQGRSAGGAKSRAQTLERHLLTTGARAVRCNVRPKNNEPGTSLSTDAGAMRKRMSDFA
nr:hypothetical protein [Ralstonia sp. UBA689]